MRRNQPPFVDKQFRTEIYKSKLRKEHCKNPAKQNEILQKKQINIFEYIDFAVTFQASITRCSHTSMS